MIHFVLLPAKDIGAHVQRHLEGSDTSSDLRTTVADLLFVFVCGTAKDQLEVDGHIVGRCFNVMRSTCPRARGNCARMCVFARAHARVPMIHGARPAYTESHCLVVIFGVCRF